VKIVVFGGCGDMGSYVVRDLVAHSEAEIIIADYRLAAAKKLAEKLDRAKAVFVDATKQESLLDVLAGADAAVGCIGPFYAFAAKMARAAIKAKVPYLDICDDHGPMEELFALEKEAKEAEITIITGLGSSPGLSNLLAKQGAMQLDEVERIKIFWVGSAADSRGLAVIMHLLYAITGKVPTYKDGKLIEVLAASEEEAVQFPQPLGKVSLFHCGHPEPITIPRYIKVKTVSIKGGLIPRWNNWLAKLFVKLGLTNTPKRIASLAKCVHAIEGIFRVGGIPLFGLRVDVLGRKAGEEKSLSFSVVDKMGRLTGIPAALGALMLAKGELRQPGVFAPEGIIEPAPFLAELAKRGINILSSKDAAMN